MTLPPDQMKPAAPLPAPDPHRWSARGPVWVGMLSVAVLVAVLGVWGNFATISGAIIANGMIQVESLRQVVQHPQGGVVGQINVEDGDKVAAGDVMIRFDDTLLKSQLATVEGQLDELTARRGRLEAERDEADAIRFDPAFAARAETDQRIAGLMEGQISLFEARRDSLTKQVEQLEERKEQIGLQIQGVAAQLAALRRQVELIGQELEDQRVLLQKGLAQASRVLALEREASRLNGSIGELEASAARGRAQIVETDLQILQLQSRRREEAITNLREINFTEIEMKERRATLTETLARLDVRAPMDGIVYGLTVFALRSVVRPADPIAYVVPTNSPFIVQARIDAINIDQVQVGQAANMRFSTFDQRTTPEIFGTVTKISADIFRDETRGISYYTAEILPNAGELARLGEVELLPGMPVESYIQTEERTPLSYLTKPMMDYFNRALRES